MDGEVGTNCAEDLESLNPWRFLKLGAIRL